MKRIEKVEGGDTGDRLYAFSGDRLYAFRRSYPMATRQVGEKVKREDKTMKRIEKSVLYITFLGLVSLSWYVLCFIQPWDTSHKFITIPQNTTFESAFLPEIFSRGGEPVEILVLERTKP